MSIGWTDRRGAPNRNVGPENCPDLATAAGAVVVALAAVIALAIRLGAVVAAGVQALVAMH